jgi:NAD(P)-dependent dehydrogenase (short-subunit alcohol dehydrogenase family)
VLAATAWTVAAGESRWSLTGRTAVVTGGSKGLGRAIVEELLDQGCSVLTCARDVSPLDELLTDAPGRCIAIEADVSTAHGRACVLEAIETHFGSAGLDILVNNVGTNLRKASTEYTDAEYEMLHATNQASAFHLSRGCYAALKKSGRGCVINVSSVSGSSNDATGAVYHMTKAAMEHMTRYLACEWGPDGRLRPLEPATREAVRCSALQAWLRGMTASAALVAQRDGHGGSGARGLARCAALSAAAHTVRGRHPCQRDRAVVHQDAADGAVARQGALPCRRAQGDAAASRGRAVRGRVHCRLPLHGGGGVHHRAGARHRRRHDVRGLSLRVSH